MSYVVAPAGGDTTTIQRAINIARAGATINVKPGVYRGGLDIRKELTIVGVGNRDEIIIEATNTDAIYFDAARGRIENLTLRVISSEDVRYGIDIAGGELEVIGCDISSNAGAGIGVHSGANPTVRNNRIHDGSSSGLLIYDNGQGIYEDNEIYNNAVVGIAITDGGNPTVTRNRIHSNRYEAIWVYDGGEGVFLNNTLTGNGGKGAFDLAEDVTIIQAGNITE